MTEQKVGKFTRFLAERLERRGFVVTPKDAVPQQPQLHPAIAETGNAKLTAYQQRLVDASGYLTASEAATAARENGERTLYALQDERDAAHQVLLESEPYKNWTDAKNAVAAQEREVANLRQAEQKAFNAAQAVKAEFLPEN